MCETFLLTAAIMVAACTQFQLERDAAGLYGTVWRLVKFQMAMTRALCPPGSLHDRMVKHWPYVRSYVIGGGHLHLSLVADGGIYEFEPLPQ